MKSAKTGVVVATTMMSILLLSNVLGYTQRGRTETERNRRTDLTMSHIGQNLTGSHIGQDLTGSRITDVLQSPDLSRSQFEDMLKNSDRGTALLSGGGMQGLSNKKVREIQEALRNAECDPGPVDGQLGPQTRAAIRKFQRLNGLTADGVVGPKTAAALDIEL